MSDFILADDVSGALDAAAAFHHAGRTVTIALTPETWPGTGDGRVVAVTTETRNAAPAIAAAMVRAAVARGQAQGGRLLYKKIDSTLRGPVAAELAALIAALPATRILFTPANPAVGRTVRSGVLLVGGVPVADTEFGRDPVSPVRESDIRRLLGDALSTRVTIADAATEDDLAAAVAEMAAAAGPWVAVGSGALARPVARCFASRPGVVVSSPAAVPRSAILMIGGSAHTLNRAQASALARERGVPVHELSLKAAAATRDAVLASLRDTGGASLLVETARANSSVVLRTVADMAGAIVQARAVRRLFITGGETAFAVFGRLGIGALQFEAELESGLSLSRADGTGAAFLCVAKPGGFGGERTWIRAWDALSAAA